MLATTPVIYREVTFSLAAFDGLKDWQRHFERSEGNAYPTAKFWTACS